jgi:hypothetical protein
MNQFSLNFEAGLLQQFPEFRDVVKAAVYSCGRALKVVAADLDMTSSELNRKLADNPNDPVNFPLHLLPALIQATGDKRPIYWLVEAFLDDPQEKKNRAIEQLAQMMPVIQSLLAQTSNQAPLKAVA